MGRSVRVAARSEITDGSGHCFEVEGRRIAIFRVGEDYFGLADDCTHRGGPLRAETGGFPVDLDPRHDSTRPIGGAAPALARPRFHRVGGNAEAALASGGALRLRAIA